MKSNRPSLVTLLIRGLAAAALMLAAGAALAGLRLVDDRPDVDAWPMVTLLADADGALDLDAVLAQRARFERPGTPHANLGVRTGAVWLRLPLRAEAGGDGRWWLELDFAPLDRIDVHLLRDGRLLRSAVLGDQVPVAARAAAVRPHAMPLVLEPGVPHELLLRVETKGSMMVPLRLAKAEAFHALENASQLLQGLAAGLALTLLMHALSQWMSTRDPMYLHYAVTVAGTSMFFFAFHGFAALYLWPSHAWLTDNAPLLAVLLALGGGALLIERLLDVRALSRPLARAAFTVAGLAWTVAALFALDIVGYRTAHLAATVLGPLPTLLAVPAAWVRLRGGDRAAPYVFAGWAGYAVGIVVMSLLARGWLDLNAVTRHAFQAGSIFEMLMWLRVLGVRNEDARRQAESAGRERELMRALAHTDALTTLPNRRGLATALRSALAASAGSERLLAVYVVDLDGFKAVNDHLGHDGGDELLVAVSRRLKATLRARDVVARLGGDEFVVLAEGLPAEADAWRLGRKLVDAFRQPFQVRGELCRVGLTVGFAIAPIDGQDAETLLKRADAALYDGKQSGKGTVRRDGAPHEPVTA